MNENKENKIKEEIEINNENKEEIKEIEINNNLNISKNQLKKLKKTQKWEEIKKLKKEQKKNNKKRKSIDIENNQGGDEGKEEGEGEEEGEENKNKNRKLKENNELQEENNEEKEENEIVQVSQERKGYKQQRNNEYIEKCKTTYPIVIDCSWENEHTDSTLKSLTQQIMFCYGINRRSEHPSQLFITGVGERTLKALSKNNCQSWKSASIHQNDFLDILPNYYQELKETNPELNIPENPLNNIIYLTSDATEILEELDDNHIYIIGGIVDRNRLKGATYNKAKELNLRTAKLPIKEYCKMKATHILTVNHVFDILKQYSKYKSWVKAIEFVLPGRKGAQLNENGEDEDSHNNNNNNNNDSNNNDSNSSDNTKNSNESDQIENDSDNINQEENKNDSYIEIIENNS